MISRDIRDTIDTQHDTLPHFSDESRSLASAQDFKQTPKKHKRFRQVDVQHFSQLDIPPESVADYPPEYSLINIITLKATSYPT